jgi:NAD(P)-dependent dehydrogenase (short-subunit alcohol dehydrogenase family)
MPRAEMADLSGRVALVTGAGSGIGAAIARLLAARGAAVFCADLEIPERLESEQADRSESRQTGLQLDVRREEDWEDSVATILEKTGRLDILVHSAGVSGASPLAETSMAEWRRVLETNLDGTFLAVRHGIRVMRESGGAIVLIGSASGIRPAAGAAAYSTSKAAVSMLARAAARECRENNFPIRVNVVSPGGVRTPIWRTMPFFQELVQAHGSEEAAFEALEAVGGSRFAEPEEVAQSVLFLVSDAASHINGVELPVDSGYVV